MATTRAGRQSVAPRKNNGLLALVGLLAVAVLALASLITINVRGGEDEQLSTPNAEHGYKFGEYDRPSKDSIPQIEDPAEMVATVLWNLLIVFNPQGYAWSGEYLDGSSKNPSLAANASRRATVAASQTLSPVMRNGVVKQLKVRPAPGQSADDATAAMIVTLSWKDTVYGNTGVANLYVVVRSADRGIWEVISIDSY